MMKDIKGYPGYKINENGVIINKNGHMMRYGMNSNGRIRVSLETYDENGKLIERKNKSVSRLVAQTLITNPENYPLVMHKDNDPLHNHVSNLQWGTQSQNIMQAFNEGRKVSPNKDNHNKYIYHVHNEDNTDINICLGYEGVAELLGYNCPATVRPGKVLSGEYKGYIVENTKVRARNPLVPLEQ